MTESGGHRAQVRDRWARRLGAITLGVLALHSLSYGGAFVVDPVSGAREFGDAAPPSEAAEHLAGLVGVILLLSALTASLAAVLLVRRQVAGAWLTVGLAFALLCIATYWAFTGSAWDAGFYGVVGLLLAGTGGVSLRR